MQIKTMLIMILKNVFKFVTNEIMNEFQSLNLLKWNMMFCLFTLR